ncbi:MAG: DHHA1 domain-containing protein, partial [Paramuribaculum sp.]
AALITLSYEELQRFGYHRGDTEALVNVPLSIPGITYSIFLREDEPDYVKVSMRSKGDFSVKQICEDHFGGGGHRNAAGGEMRCPFTVAIEKVLAVMPGYDGMLPPPDDDACPSK